MVLIINIQMQHHRQNYIRNLQNKTKNKNVQNVYQLIKEKKAELTREIGECPKKNITLPTIIADKIYRERVEIDSGQNIINNNDEEESDERSQISGSAIKYKTIIHISQPNEETIKKIPNRVKNQHLYQKLPLIQQSSLQQSKIKTNRIKSEQIVNERKLTMKTQQNDKIKYQMMEGAPQNMEDAKKQFLLNFENIPKTIKGRNEQNLRESVRSLQMFNPFFNRNHRVTNICLLKVGHIVAKQNCLLYKMGDENPYFYIILLGKVKIVNGGLKKICQTGETILEEILYCDKLRKIALERAKVIGRAILLQVTVENMRSIREEMVRHGFRFEIQEMETVIKRNYIVKNWLRNKIKKQNEN